MRIATAILAALALAGCKETANVNASRAHSAHATEDAPFFVGRWAAEEAMCGNAAWQFTESSISTPGHVVCKFNQVDNVGGVYQIDATCTAEGPPARYQLKISYAQSAGALLVEGGPFQPIGLVACR
ncbi:hypothetical protein [Rhodoligotrophos defluvii]|uniref:hypothetical protein n=1 Tax=Rhodoligotrophos defluvii TaxID=2561934 RepID=UPI0010C9393F|nr:hypothetical protein [Rhodoligotrophos defluvii]